MALFPDLSQARKVLDRLMVDTCRISRDSQGPDDDVWNAVTGTYTKPANDETTIYDGKCKFSPEQNRSDLPREEGARPLITRNYYGLLPWDAPEIRPGDLFTIITSARDPRAAGLTFVVLNMVVTTMLVSRRITLEEVSDAFVGVRGS